MKTNILLLPAMLLMVVFYSCTYTCTCIKRFNCRILSANYVLNDSLLTQEIVCSDSNYYFDSTYNQEIALFYKKFYKENEVKIVVKDSLFYEEIEKVRGGKEQKYIDNGFVCPCAK